MTKSPKIISLGFFVSDRSQLVCSPLGQGEPLLHHRSGTLEDVLCLCANSLQHGIQAI